MPARDDGRTAPGKRSNRNRTMTLSPDERAAYARRCLLPGRYESPDEIRDGIILGDAFEALSLLPASFADLLIVDPPYNLRKRYDRSVFRNMSDEAYEHFTMRWVDAVLPLLKRDASVYVCCDWRSSLAVGSVLQRRLTVRNRITWQREKGRGTRCNWKNGMEDIWFATVSDDYVFHVDAVKLRRRVIAPYRVDGVPKGWQETEEGNFRDTCPSNFWDDISIPYWSMPENTDHPTQKPEKLLAKLILASSDEGDVVFDPFLGSGTTAVTAKKLGRHYVGVEREESYCALAQKRLEQAACGDAIQGYEDGVFWERNSQRRRTLK